MILTPAQNKIASDVHRFRVVNCGRRFGKTSLAIEEIKGKALSNSNKICYIAPTYQQARDIAWEAIKKEFQAIIITVNESRLELKVKNIKEGESIVVLRGWESVDTLRGQSFDFLVIDEISSMRNFWTNWQEVLRPTLTDRKGEVLFISTPKGFNHFYDLYNFEIKDTNYKSFHFTSYDNPHIPREEIDQAAKELTVERFSQEYMADFTKTEGLVYKEFDRNKHIYTEGRHAFREVISGVDFGYSNPCACYSIGSDFSDKYWIFDEFYKTNKTDAEVAEYVAAKQYAKVYPDPESPSAIEEMRRRGVNVREVIKGKDSIKNGIDTIRELLKAGRLMIHNSCLNLISEFETYSYPDKREGRNESELPIDENNHALDSIRYALMMHNHQEVSGLNVFIPEYD